MRLHFWVKDENEEERTQASSLPLSLSSFSCLSFLLLFIFFLAVKLRMDTGMILQGTEEKNKSHVPHRN